LPWQPIKVEKLAFFPAKSNLLHCLKWTAVSQSNFKRFNSINFSTLCTTLVTFGPETPEVMLLTMTLFVAIWQKLAYYARMSWTYIDLLYRFGRRIGGDDYPNIRLAVAKGTLLWQPVKFGGSLQTSPETTLTRCSDVIQQIDRS